MINPLNKYFGKCNLCNGLVVRINSSFFGFRCTTCFSTLIHRAIGVVIEEQLNKIQHPEELCVYELSSRGALFKFLRKRFPHLYFSEYYDDVAPGEYKNNVQCQDVQQLILEDNQFDIITSTEVFEHVVNDRLGFKEVFRVLKNEGLFIFTVPLYETPETQERAYMNEEGKIVHILPPEYHGDRIRGKRDVLAFRNYGLDIEQRLIAAGFGDVNIKRIHSDKYKIDRKQVIVAIKRGETR